MAKIPDVVIKVKVQMEGTTMDDLVNRFRFHKASESKGATHGLVRSKCYDLATELNELLPEGREKSLTLTKLEEVMFWANAAIARSSDDKTTKLNDSAYREHN